MTVSVQRADNRFLTDLGWLDSKHSFNFDHHYSPEHTRHGLLLVHNDDTVAAGKGFGTHGHRDMEIVTWVLSGTLAHQDSEGNNGTLYRGLAQRMSAGSGIRHSEMNPDPDVPAHFIQMWVLPDTAGVKPGYEQLDVNAALDAGGLVPIASGQHHEGAVSIHQKDAVLWGSRLSAGESVTVPNGANVHLFVAVGSADLEGCGDLGTGDAVRLSGTDATSSDLKVTAGAEGAELLIWVTA